MSARPRYSGLWLVFLCGRGPDVAVVWVALARLVRWMGWCAAQGGGGVPQTAPAALRTRRGGLRSQNRQ